MRYLIIQPATFEEVLASACYVAFWTDTALRRAGHDTEFHEDCTFKHACNAIEQWHEGPVLIDVSSPPQVEIALALKRVYGAERELYAIGYSPLAQHHGLRTYDIAKDGVDILVGVQNYLYDFDRYEHAYATIDGHLLCHGDKRPFVPAFFGVGCPRGCEYCYVSREHYPFGFVAKEAGLRLLDYMVERQWNIHFEDENFFLHRNALDFVRHLRGKATKWICLTDSLLLSRTINRVGVEELLDCGHWLSEIGLETTDTSVLSKRQDIEGILAVQNHDAQNVQHGTLNVFWLAVTLLPDETLASLNRNGEFYREHGIAYERIEPRLRTQSTVGGLGQFFVPYPGTKFWLNAVCEGMWVAEPPLRLRPSWLGFKLATECPVVVREPTADERVKWLALYTHDAWQVDAVLERCNGARSVLAVVGQGKEVDTERLAVLCCLAKLGCLKSAAVEV